MPTLAQRGNECRNRAADTGHPNFLVISDLTPLNQVFSIFKKSFSHLMIAATFEDASTGAILTPEEMAAWASHAPAASSPPPFTSRFTGIITLEDVLEQVIDHQILDEQDALRTSRNFTPSDKVRHKCEEHYCFQ
jgi:hypothetical protein